MSVDNVLNRIWYHRHPSYLALLPFSLLYGVIITIRQFLYALGLFSTYTLPVPVIVVGNITAGGTGKTPFVIWLAEYLASKGHHPGIISRGYGRRSDKKIQAVKPDSDPEYVGDEPVLISKRTGLPVAVSSDRYKAAKHLIKTEECDIIISDDGLQHLALGRDIEIALIDGERGYGNRHLLPAGPLREPLDRLSEADILVSKEKPLDNSFIMNYKYSDITSVINENSKIPISSLQEEEIHLISGIACPELFHHYFIKHNIKFISHVFPDHYKFTSNDLDFDDNKHIVMTEKDAVKCKKYANEKMWFLPVDAAFNEAFYHRINTLISEKIDGQKIT